MSRKSKLELTWVGKENRPRLEPRVLIDVPDLSHAGGPGIMDNLLVQGDNLLALKALEADYAGRVKCVFIDPPYNTGSAFEHYDDGLEHSIWLSMMRDRLELIHKLLSPDGSLWVTLDDNEAHYFKVMADEVFGRRNFITGVAWRSSDAANNDAKSFSLDHNHLLAYGKEVGWLSNPLPRTEEANAHYKNPDNDPDGPWFAGNLSSPKPRPNLRFNVISPTGIEIPPPANGWRWKESTMNEMIENKEIVFSSDGKRLIKKTYLKKQGGLAPSSIWFDLEETGHNRQAKYELKKLFPERETSDLFGTPKPEKLLQKILTLATNPGDLVLDSFAGSGTTGAVAHKMGRRWIMVEIGDHAQTHIVPRLRKVIDGTDAGGVTAATNWQGGGGFRFCRLAPSLITRDKWGREVISAAYDAPLLAQALCKIKGFRYDPSEVEWWAQGKSSDTDFLHVTTQTLSHEQLAEFSELVGEDRTLLILCAAWRGDEKVFPNLTVSKIPDDVLKQCDFGRDDYGLPITGDSQ